MVLGNIEREENSALVRVEYVARYSDFRVVKRALWKDWFKARVGRTDLLPADKLVLWIMVDRWRLCITGQRKKQSLCVRDMEFNTIQID